MTLPLLLSVYYRYYRSGPSSTGYRNCNIRTSGRSTAPVRSTTSLWWWLDPRDPPFDLWDGIPPGISSRRGSLLLRWVARKNFIAKSPRPIPAGIRR